ncbi:hypothetical protein FSP39_023677 [Pinctada imbricata]|uniref:E3 ubiquitin-protein ligase MARCHF5 n=1 Tax=Pinctada imbricata TaxID=66713 RepID=A0AA88Y1U4_PINIB|nr:hypothetical protein FSP39_023677 [Pinctada imbricata]
MDESITLHVPIVISKYKHRLWFCCFGEVISLQTMYNKAHIIKLMYKRLLSHLNSVAASNTLIYEEPSCWVCFATEEDDSEAEWVSPCRCKGTSGWVHQTCLQRWIDEKQKGDSSAAVACPQCNTGYIIDFPSYGLIMRTINSVDTLIYRACPFGAGLIFCGTVYWTAFSYGCVVVTQVCGSEEGLNKLQDMDPWVMLVSMPMIPVVLILGRMIRWEDYILRIWRKHSSKIPLINYMFPYGDSGPLRTPADPPSPSDPICATRILCGALAMPTFAVMFGKMMFGTVKSHTQRTVLGGVAYVALKGALKIYFRQQQYIRQSYRIIKNFSEPVVISDDSSDEDDDDDEDEEEEMEIEVDEDDELPELVDVR